MTEPAPRPTRRRRQLVARREPVVQQPAPETSPVSAPAGLGGGGRLRNLSAGLDGYPAFPLGILFGLQAVDELDRTAFAVLSPEIRDSFDLSLTAIGAIAGGVAAIALLSAVLFGYLGDRMSRVRLALGGAAVWACFSAGTGLAPAVVLLLVARLGAGVGKAVNEPVHRSLLSDYYPPKARATAYFAHNGANDLGRVIAPLAAGGVAGLFGNWRAAFILAAVPTALLVFAGAARLREPARGRFERADAGASDDLLDVEEDAPSVGEAWQTLHGIPTLRRTFFAIPFLGAAIGALGVLVNNFYEEVYGLSPMERGVWGSLTAFTSLLGFVVFARYAFQVLVERPRQVYVMVAAATPFVAFGFIGITGAPSFPLSIAAWCLIAFATAPLQAGPVVALSMVIPPRMRTFGFAIGAVYALPATAILLPILSAADSRSYLFASFLLLPVLLTGSAIIVSAGRTVVRDAESVKVSALARAEAIRSRREGTAKLLVARGVDVKYGQTQVLFGVDMEIEEGEIVALLGTNGAGKSTFLNALTGLAAPSGGAIIYDGIDITQLPANQAVELGIVMVPGGKAVFPTMTVRENLELAGWIYDKDPEHVEKATAQVLEYFPVLRERWNEKAGNMSGGEQQMLALGQAFIAKPRLLAIDELSLGLAPVIVEQLLGIVRSIHAQGTTIVLVEQSVNVACTLAERAVFMEKGEVRFDGPTADLLDRPDVLRAVYLQGSGSADSNGVGAKSVHLIDREARQDLLARERVCLEVVDLSVSFGGIQAVDDVNLSLRNGEILGLIGPNGAGKTTIMDLVSGFLTPNAGKVLLHGHEVTKLSPDQRARAGLGRAFQDARLLPSLTVTETLAVALERHIQTRDALAAAVGSPATKLAEKRVAERVDELIELTNLQAFANKFVSELSTGSRRVVGLACLLAHQPSVLLLDEPSSGIAQKETEALGPMLVDIREKTGAGILIIEHDMPLIQGVSDRLLAMELGAVVTSGDPLEVINHPRVIEAYLGGNQAVINRSGRGAGQDSDLAGSTS